MSERLPYEDDLQQHWTDLPLPDENKAWEDMRRRLEEDDDGRPIIAWWRRGCLLWGLLLLVIFGSGLWLVKKKYFTSDDKRKVTVNKQDEHNDNKRNDTVIIQTIPSNTVTNSAQESIKDESGPLKEITGGQQSKSTDNTTTVNNPVQGEGSIISDEHKSEKIEKRRGIQNPIAAAGGNRKRIGVKVSNDNNTSNSVVGGQRKNIKAALRKPVADPLKPPKNNTDNKNNVTAQFLTNEIDSVKAGDSVVFKGTDSTGTRSANDSLLVKTTGKKDSITSTKPVRQDSSFTNTAKKDSTKKKQLSYSAGISMQQLLPVAGQKTVPYNSQGRKGTLADYIPSIYFRVNKDQKWFIQGEFKYGAPQYTREFVYKQERREDTLSPTQTFTTRTSNTLKKTYYHQLPVTFNYFLTKDWSAGAGLSWNKFVSAISDQEITRRNNSTTIDSVISKGIVREKQDSASGFAKSYFQGVLESQYKWKRFSFGARYTFGLQPYLKFTLLNGETGKESNRSLQIFLRYELWQSKKKE